MDALIRQSRLLVLFLLLAGIGVRFLDISNPILDAQLFRQTQTADAIRGFIEQPGFQLDANVTWKGDLPARIVQELPVYNMAVEGIYWGLAMVVPHASVWPGDIDPRLIDISGRIVSVFFWALAFLALQLIWRRALTGEETLWANLLFVFCPLSVFFGQAVMPEMVFLAVSIGFLGVAASYVDRPTAWRWAAMVFLGLLGCLLKFPAFSHLGLIAVVLVLLTRKLGFIFRPLHWLAAAIVLLAMAAWSAYVSSVNAGYFFEWTPFESLKAFIGQPQMRLDPRMYLKIFFYETVFIVTPVGLVFAIVGLWRIVRESRLRLNVASLWLYSLPVFVLVWGVQTASNHSYYNLPMLGPACYLFGLGAVAIRRALVTRIGVRAGNGVFASALVLWAALLVAGNLYLFKQDRSIWKVAEIIREKTQPGETVALKLNHRTDSVDYQHIPAVSYYAGRRCWIISKAATEMEREGAARRASLLIVTKRPDMTKADQMLRRFVKGEDRKEDDLSWFIPKYLMPDQLQKVSDDDLATVYLIRR